MGQNRQKASPGSLQSNENIFPQPRRGSEAPAKAQRRRVTPLTGPKDYGVTNFAIKTRLNPIPGQRPADVAKYPPGSGASMHRRPKDVEYQRPGLDGGRWIVIIFIKEMTQLIFCGHHLICII